MTGASCDHHCLTASLILRGCRSSTRLEGHLADHVAAQVDSFVFTRPTGRPLRRQDLSHAWTAACAVVGTEGARPHDLRHHAATVIARNPTVTLRELMATIGPSSHIAALRYQHATAERSKEIASYLDGVISATIPESRPSPSAAMPEGCGLGVAWHENGQIAPTKNRALELGRREEAAVRIELTYGALQAPA